MKYIFLLFLISTVNSCKSTDNSVLEIDPRSFEDNEIKLSEIAEDVTYIPLDTQLPIGLIYTYMLSDNSIYLSAKDVGVLKFNREGILIGNIGKSGRGPGEYTYCMSFAVDEINGSVYIMDSNVIRVYSRNGTFLRSIILKEFGANFHEIYMFDAKLFIPEYIAYGKAKYNWIILDTLGTLIKKKENTIPMFSSTIGAGGGTFKYKDRMSYWNWYDDTVYTVMPGLNYKTSFLISPGPHRIPRSKFEAASPSEFTSQMSSFILLRPLFETDRFMVFRYFYKKPVIAFFEKKSRKSFLTFLESGFYPTGTNFKGGILNDLDGGPAFQPDSYSEENGIEFMISLLNPVEVKTHVASKEYFSSIPKYPEKKQELEKLAARLKETDNPILMIVRLKK